MRSLLATLSSPRRRVVSLAMALAFSLLSCGREITGPGDGVGVRFAEGLSFVSLFPEPLQGIADGIGSIVPFERVRIVFRRADNSVALDTVVAFSSQQVSLELRLRVALSASAPADGEPLSLALAFVNAAGDTVFRGGPVPVIARVLAAGAPPPEPALVPLTYTGVGADAVTVAILPETLFVVAGDSFVFNGAARDAQAGVIPSTPLLYSALEPARALLVSRNAGRGVTTTLRGTSRIRVQLPTGSAADTAILVVSPRPGALSVVSGGGQTAAPASSLAQPVVVRLLATDGQPLVGAPISVAVTTGGGSVIQSDTLTDGLGRISFAWTTGGSVGAQTATVSSPGVPNLVVNANSQILSATQLRITQQIGSTYQAGDSLPLLLVEVRNSGGVRDSTFADTVFLSFAVNPSAAALVGTTRAAAVAGLARFENFRVQRVGTGYRLLVSAPGLAPDTSTAFTVTARPASTLAIVSGANQAAAASTLLPQPVIVRVADAFNNPIAGHIVAFSLASGLLSQSADTTDAAGLASVQWTLGASAGAQTLTVTAAGLSGSPLLVPANAGGSITTTTVTPGFDTLTAIGATRTFVATARDGGNAIVPGSYTWLSRAPAIAGVDSAGRVNAITNGETWIVATEAGGTRDSARVVVQQRLATINVIPGARSIYLGASFSFTASAVDGLGVALLAQPTFTWSTVSSAIASITVGGVATAVGLGATQVRATAGAVTGVSALTVLTPITRIAVVRDSIGFVASDTFSLDALARTRSYRAVAFDTLDAVMSGITFAWVSSNPSVANIDSSGSVTARAVALANGFTAIRAVAQGVIGAASLTVAQVMTSIELSPAAASIAPTGSVVLTPRRRDANNFFIPGGSFTFASADPGTATVSASGVVTGIAIGGTTVTATSGAVTSNTAAITVTNSVPPIISFGRDTLAIGRSATNVAIPVYLSRPFVSGPVTVNLAVADTFAFFAPVSVTIPAGQTVGTALLNGRNAGTTQVFATDGGGGGYAGDTAVLAVQATVRLTTTNYAMTVNDERPTQVILSDPAPVGGSFITFTHGTPGRVSISPDPAFIPFGQLTADIVIRGLTAGSTTITPAATGVNGTASTVTTSAAVLQISNATARVGAGQYRQNLYVYVPQNLTNPLTITVANSDSTFATAPAELTIPSGISYVYFDVAGLTPGTATLTYSAPGWSGTSSTVIVSSPTLSVSGGGTFPTTQPAIAVTAYVRDSIGSAYNRTSALAVQLASSDTSVLRVLTPSVTVPAGNYYVGGQVITTGNPGTAYLIVSASGHRPDSVLYTFNGPRLQFSFNSSRVGAGQYVQNHYVYAPNNVTSPLTVTITSDSSIVSAPLTVTIPTNSSYVYFDVAGRVPGTSQMIATAPGYSPDTASMVVTTPRIAFSGGGGNLNNFSNPSAITVISADSLNSSHPRSDTLIVTYVSTNPAALTVTAADTIMPGAYFANRARVTPIGVDTAKIIVSAPGHGADTISYNVVTPRLLFSFNTYRIGNRQYRPRTAQYVYIPNARGVTVPVTITQSNAAIDSLTSTTLTIPDNLSYEYFGFAGLGTGTDTLIASAPGYLPDTAVIIVTSPRLIVNPTTATATTTTPPRALTLYVADSVGSSHYSLDTLLVSATSTNAAVIQPDSIGLRIPAGAISVSPRINFVGPGSATVIYADSNGTGYAADTTNIITVTGPTLTLYNGRPVLGMRQNGANVSSYVQIPNVIATPLVVNLISTDPTVATVPATVTIPAGQTYSYFQISAQDVAGTIQIQASATGYGGATVNQQVTLPRFVVSVTATLNTTSPPTTIFVAAADANGTQHYVNEPVSVTLASLNAAAGTIDSATVTIPAGAYFHNTARFTPLAAGTTTIEARDVRGTSYSYSIGSATVSVVTPNLGVSWSGSLTLGLGQWADRSVSVPNTRTSPLTVTLAHSGTATTTPGTVTINTGTSSAVTRVSAVAMGADTITFSAAGHNSVLGAVTVGLGQIGALSGWPTTLATDSAEVTVTLYARDQSGAIRNVTAATTFALAMSSGSLQARVAGVPVTDVTIPANAQSVSFQVRRISAGSASMTITNANYTTQITPTVTMP